MKVVNLKLPVSLQVWDLTQYSDNSFDSTRDSSVAGDAINWAPSRPSSRFDSN